MKYHILLLRPDLDFEPVNFMAGFCPSLEIAEQQKALFQRVYPEAIFEIVKVAKRS